MGFFLLVYVDVDYNIAVGSSSNREAMSRPFWGTFMGPYFRRNIYGREWQEPRLTHTMVVNLIENFQFESRSLS